jgi:hypothetical protein
MRSAILIAASVLALSWSAPLAAEVPADVAAAPDARAWPEDDGLWVRHHLRVTLDAQGRITREVEQALKPYTDKPMREDLLDPRIDWNDTRSTLDVLEAVTWMVDGTEVPCLGNSFVPNTAGVMQWAVPYAAMRQLTVAHVGVEHGSTSLLHYRIADRGALGMPMWGMAPLADFMPIHDLLVRLEAPSGSSLKVGMMELEGMTAPALTIREEATGAGSIYELRGSGIAGLNLNENHGELGVPTLVWSTSPSWKATRAWLEAQVEPSAMADGYVRAKLDEVLDGSINDAERIARIHDFVVQAVRSIDWSPLDFGYATRSAPEVLNSSVGHPLDKAVLLVSMLRAAGFEAHVALAAPTRAWAPEVPSPVPFEQVWVKVGQGHHTTWIDPTAPQDAHNRVHLAGKPVLVLDGSAEAPVVLPEFDLDHNHAQLRVQLELSPDGEGLAASGRADLDLAGGYSPVPGFDRSADRASGVAGGLAGLFGGAEHDAIVGHQSPAYLSLGADYEGGGYEPLASGLVKLELPRVPGALSTAALQTWRAERSLPVSLAAPARELVVVEFALPAGWEAAALPQEIELDEPIGSYERTVLVEDGVVTIRSELALKHAVVAPQAWPQLRMLLNEADNTRQRTVLLRPLEED